MANPRIEVEIGAKINEFERKFNEVDKQLEGTGKQFNKLNEFATGALQGIAAAFTVGAVVNFGKAVLDTTAKFQKFEAVLTNTLGSGSAAQIALIQISKFAAETPFQVDELTSAFVKLANQGFTPTVAQLRSLGDLAASTGKSFDQLAEAIIDAQVGEFERLKEFGIRAKKEGDNVTFTFKGVETQVKNTNEAIRDYVLSLGDAEGVSGAMAKVSETLGGKISNLEDNIEALRLAIGNQTSGIFAASLDWLNSFVEATTRAAKGVARIREEANFSQLTTQIDANRKAVIQLAEDYQSLDPNLTRQEAFRKAISFLSSGFKEARDNVEAFSNQVYTTSELNEIISGFDDLFNEFVIGGNKVDESTKSFEQFSKEWDDYNLGLETTKMLNDSLSESFSKLDERISKISQSIIPVVKSFKEIQIDLPDAPPQQDTTSIQVPFFDNLLNELNKNIPLIEERLTTFAFNVDQILRDNVANAFVDLGYTIGEALAQGGNVIKAVGQSLLRSFSRFLGQLGEQLILYGTAGLAFGKLSLALTNPLTALKAAPLAIIAGVALTAAAGAIGSIGQRGLGGSSVGTSGLGAGTSFSGGATGFGFAQNREIRGELVARGQDLVYVFNEANTRINKG